MSVTTTYPGVYITEIPSGSRTIVGVATSITAFVGSALRGPVDEPVPIASFADFERRFGGLWRGSGLAYSVRDFYLNGGGEALIVRVVHVDEADEDASAASATLDIDGLGLEAAGPGDWGNALQVVVTHPSGTDAADVADGQGVEETDLFSIVVREGAADDAGPSETYLNVTTVEGPRRVDVVLGASRMVHTTGTLPASRPAEGTYTVAATAEGRDGEPPALLDYQGDADAKTGLYALLKASLFNLLCIPPPTLGTDVPDSFWSEAAAFCQQQRAFLLVDAPAGETVDGIATWVTGTAGLTGSNMRNAAVYFPRIRRPDPLRGGATADFAACGALAGTYRPHRRQSRRLEGAGRHRGGARRRRRSDGTADRRRERSAQPPGHQLPAHLPRHRLGGLGRAHPARRGPARRRVQVRPGPPAGAVHRGDAVPQHAVGGLRAERRAAVVADPGVDRRLHAGPVPPGRLPGHRARGTRTSCGATPTRRRSTTSTAASSTSSSGSPRSSRPSSSSSASSRRPRLPAPDATTTEEERGHGRVHRQRHAVRPVQELQVPREVGRPVRRRGQQGRRAEADHRGRQAPQRRRPEQQPQVARPLGVRGDHARARRHARRGLRAVGEQGVELRLRAGRRRRR